MQKPREIKHIGVPPGVRGQITLPVISTIVPVKAKRKGIAKNMKYEYGEPKLIL